MPEAELETEPSKTAFDFFVLSIFQNSKSNVSQEKVGFYSVGRTCVHHKTFSALETLRGKVEVHERRGERNFC